MDDIKDDVENVLKSKANVKRLTSSVNRYFDKLFDYPDSLFPGFNLEDDISRIQGLLDSNKENRIILEFGSGSGAHLIELARMKSSSIVLGFEIRFKRSVRTLEKAVLSGLDNLYVFRGRSELAAKLLGDRKVNEVYINFPDPWEKKRWRKHRILSASNLRMIASILVSGGVLSVKTDHQEYFETFLEEFHEAGDVPFSLEACTRDLQTVSNSLEQVPPEALIQTEFEKLFRSQGKPVCYLRLRKI